jgi:molybdate transport system permease protein
MSDWIVNEERAEQVARYRRRAGQVWWLMSLPLALFIMIPLASLFLETTPMNLVRSLAQPQVYQAIAISLGTSTAATLLSIFFGTPLALLMARRDFRFKRLVDTLIDLPTVLPPAVAGVALLMAFGRRGLVGAWLDGMGVTLTFTPMAVIMAQTFIAASLYIKSAAIGFAGVNPELEQAAALDGAGGWYIFRTITLPLARMALLSGAVMTWARALGEFGATIIFAGNLPGRTQTMPLAIYIGFELDTDIAITLAVILVAISFITLLVVKGALGERSG